MKTGRVIALLAGTFFLSGLMIGCAGLEYAPKRDIMYYHKELPAADRAVEAARKAGKDKECPAEFQAAEKMKNDAYEIYWSCRTQEGIAKAKEATALANGLCPKKAMAPEPAPMAPPPPPPPLPAPTVSLSASPAAVDAGKCTSLTWSSANADSATIDQGIGTVNAGGTKEVCPAATTLYTITATGQGGSKTASATVTVNPPPPPPAEKPVRETISLAIEFDTAKADIRPKYNDELAKVAAYLKKYPETTVSIEGHTDNVGGEKYNQKLSERRAESVKKALVERFGVDASRISTKGYGLSKPIADNKTREGKQKNRRIEAIFR